MIWAALLALSLFFRSFPASASEFPEIHAVTFSPAASGIFVNYPVSGEGFCILTVLHSENVDPFPEELFAPVVSANGVRGKILGRRTFRYQTRLPNGDLSLWVGEQTVMDFKGEGTVYAGVVFLREWLPVFREHGLTSLLLMAEVVFKKGEILLTSKQVELDEIPSGGEKDITPSPGSPPEPSVPGNEKSRGLMGRYRGAE